jgi:hypothetical protein
MEPVYLVDITCSEEVCVSKFRFSLVVLLN